MHLDPGVSLCPQREEVSEMKQSFYLQMWHGYWRVPKPVPKLLIPVINRACTSLQRLEGGAP